ncbi:MAG: tyrosine-protein phosphatase [Prevotella sp.]|nr:tyrosine-protein phosphatase [Prevotella sp.]
MKKILPLYLVSIIILLTSCSKQDNPAEEPVLKSKIVSYNEFGCAMLEVTEADMKSAGFNLGDDISITVEGQELNMPYFDGFYTPYGEMICVAYSTYPSVCFTRNSIGVPQELRGLEGHAVTIKMKKQGGSIDVQKAMGMSFYNERSKYPNLSDAQFANARVVNVGNITSGVFCRSSSPFSNEIGRATYVSQFMEEQNVKTVLNVADTKEKMLSYDMPPYSRTIWESGNVILCPLKVNYTSDDYNKPLIEALKELPSHPAPYLLNCVEGKDRTGYVCAMLEGLCGATYDEIVADYLVSYANYFNVTPESDPQICNTLVTMRLHPCLMYYTGVADESQLPKVDYAKAFSSFLLAHGMTQQQLDALVQALTGK